MQSLSNERRKEGERRNSVGVGVQRQEVVCLSKFVLVSVNGHRYCFSLDSQSLLVMV